MGRFNETLPEKKGPDREPNAALREIAGRLKKLSYRDTQRLAGAFGRDPAVILAAADTLETA